mmetsp:Transcript_33584/g.62938  ORF Transcript_33584/g.62938 Transcript_33584/m.62938 type:complete len:231 (+) Transcript_33584:75-767(+)
MRSLPFCRNWNTAVATSCCSGFLSGCHLRSRIRNSFRRFSFGSTSFSFISFSSASALAFSISGFVSLGLSGSSSSFSSECPALALLLDRTDAELSESEELLLLSFLCFFFFRFFFLWLLLEELLEGLFLFRLRLLEGLCCGGGPAPPSPRPFLYISLMALDPACGDRLRFGAGTGTWGIKGVSPTSGGFAALHLKHSKRFMKLRSPQLLQYQSLLRSSSWSPPGPRELKN